MSLKGNLYVISAPSGTGKTSLVNALIEKTSNVKVSISHTTRPKRVGETHGVNYYFIDEQEFAAMVAHHDFLEHATVFHYHYGTSESWVNKTLNEGLDVILEIDWQGAQQVKKKFPDSISIFILPPSCNDLSVRLKNRNQDGPEVIKERLQDAFETMSHINEFDYVVKNADFEHAVTDLKTIIESRRLLGKVQCTKYKNLIAEFFKNP